MFAAIPLTTLLLAAAPVSISLEPMQSEVAAVPGARLTALLTTALRQASSASQATLVDANALVTVTGQFAPEGKGYRWNLVVRSPTASKALAFEYKSTAVGEVGAMMIAQVIVREAQNVAAVPRQEPALTSSTGSRESESGSSFDDASTTPAAVKAPVAPAAPNSIWAEGGGAGLNFSLNYERRFFDDVGVRAGVEVLPLSATNGGLTVTSTTIAFPIGVSYLGLRSGKHGLEVGAGLTVYVASSSNKLGGTVVASASNVYPLGWVQAGYRYHPVQNAGFNFRIGVMAMIGGAPLYQFTLLGFAAHLGPSADSLNITPWAYISFGASF
jgi:hypothetical protein